MTAYTFKIINKAEFTKDLSSLITKKIEHAYIKTLGNFEMFIDKKINGKWVEETDIYKWMNSEDGLGWLGWKPDRLEYEIDMMKQIVRTYLYKNVRGKKLSLGLAPYNKMANELVAKVTRHSTETGERYTFVESWFEWLSEGYSGNPEFIVAYKMGKGESGLAFMHDLKRGPSMFVHGVIKVAANELKKMKHPYVQIFERHKTEILDFLVDNFKKNLAFYVKRRV